MAWIKWGFVVALLAVCATVRVVVEAICPSWEPCGERSPCGNPLPERLVQFHPE